MEKPSHLDSEAVDFGKILATMQATGAEAKDGGLFDPPDRKNCSAEIAAVFTDIMMPIMDGTATIRVLQRMNSRVPIIAASGLMANAQLAQFASLGVKHFLPKTYTAATLLTTLRQVIAGD